MIVNPLECEKLTLVRHLVIDKKGRSRKYWEETGRRDDGSGEGLNRSAPVKLKQFAYCQGVIVSSEIRGDHWETLLRPDSASSFFQSSQTDGILHEEQTILLCSSARRSMLI